MYNDVFRPDYETLFTEFGQIWHAIVKRAETEGLWTNRELSEGVVARLIDENYFPSEIERLKEIQARTALSERVNKYFEQKCSQALHSASGDAYFNSALHGEPNPMRLVYIYLSHFYDVFNSGKDAIEFEINEFQFTDDPEGGDAFSLTFKNLNEAQPDDLFIGMNIRTLENYTTADQVGFLTHEIIHDILKKSAIMVRDGTMEHGHPLYEAGLMKLHQAQTEIKDTTLIWSIYINDPEEDLCYQLQNYVENVLRGRLLPNQKRAPMLP